MANRKTAHPRVLRKEMRHLCPKCGRTFTWRYNLQHHLKYACGQLPRFNCPYCAYRTKHTSNVRAHVRRKHPDREVYVVDLMSVQHWAKHTIKVLYVDEKLRDKLRFDHRILIKIILTRRTLTRSLKNPCVHVVSFVRISYVFSLYRDIIVYLYIVYFIYCKIYWTSIWDYSNIFMLLGI